MIHVFTGDDRVKIQREIRRVLGKEYEVFEGENLRIPDIYNICQGNSLFSDTRKILIKDLTPAREKGGESGVNMEGTGGENAGATGDAGDAGTAGTASDPYAIFAKFLDTKHEIVIWESNVPNRKAYRDFVSKVEVKKFQKEEFDKWASFRIFDLAYTDGRKAVSELERLVNKVQAGGEVKMLDPYLVVGAFSSSALKKFEQNPTVKNKKVLKEVAKLDMQMKTSRIEPWTLVKVFLLKLENL